MESKAHYALIGTFVLLFFVVITAFVAWFSGAQFDQQFDDYEVVFTGPVRGLSEGSEVRFNGLRVGEVTNLSLDTNNSSSVIVTIQVISDTPVHTDSYAQLEPLGLTGLNYIQIFSGDQNTPLLQDLPGSGPYRIPGRMSQIDGFFEGGTSVIEGAQLALNRINSILTEDTVADVKGILANVNRLSGKLAELDIDPELAKRTLVAFEEAARNVADAAAALDKAASEAQGLISTDARALLTKAEGSLGEVDNTLADISVLANNGTGLVTDTRDAVNRLSNSSLTDLETTLDDLQRLVETLNDIADGIEQNPIQFIVGEEKRKVELPQ